MNTIERLKNIILHPYKIKSGFYRYCIPRLVSDEAYIKAMYRSGFGKPLNLENPITYNEKLQWLKLYDRNPQYTSLVDKYECKGIVGSVIGQEYIVPTIAVYSDADSIDLSSLPQKFVLKCTHDSGSARICVDKNTFDLKEAKAFLNKRLKKNPYYDSREWPYKNVNPRIICENYLENTNGEEILDYKFICFNGIPKTVFICSNRRHEELYVDFFDMEWNHKPFERHYHNSKKTFSKPVNFELMINLAKKLSKDIPHVRVDFYEVNGKVYFGELTFFPGSGMEEFTPESWDKVLGDYLTLPEKKI